MIISTDSIMIIARMMVKTRMDTDRIDMTQEMIGKSFLILSSLTSKIKIKLRTTNLRKISKV